MLVVSAVEKVCKEITKEGICITEKGDQVATFKFFETVFGNVAQVVLGLAGIVLFIMLISGGFKYITAGGDPKGIEGAKKTLTYAIGGMVFLAMAFLILRFIQEFTGVDVTRFRIFQEN